VLSFVAPSPNDQPSTFAIEMSLGVLTANVVLGRLCLILFSRSILDLGLMLAPAVTSSLHS
jgi:hypothetical protein